MTPYAVSLWNFGAFGAPLEFQAFFTNAPSGANQVFGESLPVTIDLASGASNFVKQTWGADLSLLTQAIPAVGKFAPFAKSILLSQNFAGTSFDLLQSGADNADGIAVSATFRLLTTNRGTLFNGTTWDRARSASAANQSTQPVVGAAVVTGPGNWTLTSAPAVNTQATATRAAGGAGVRHILNSIAIGVNATTPANIPAAGLLVVVRDGASGVGTILWQINVGAAGNVPVPFGMSGLNIVGSANTAMTVEFTTAPGATNFETVSATGYDAT